MWHILQKWTSLTLCQIIMCSCWALTTCGCTPQSHIMELTSAALISTSLLCKNKSLWSYSANTELHRNQFIVVRIVVPCIILVMEHLFSFIFLLILGIFNKPSKEVIVNIYSIKDRSGTINFTFKIQFFHATRLAFVFM